jgi:6-hydroxytryprostatin B O-methyltransferase
LAAVTRFEIPQKVPFGKSISLTDLASVTGLSEDHLTRIVRYAIANGIFSEPEPGQIAHTAASATLAKNKNLHDMTLFNSGFSTRIVVGLADALRAQQEKQENAPEAAFNLAYPAYVNLFDYVGKNPTASQEYFSYLDGRSQLSRYAVGKVAKSWDWASLGSGTIVDVGFCLFSISIRSTHLICFFKVGGSSGYTSIALANSFSAAKFVVQDVNVAGLEMGRASISGKPDLESRITFQEHDFFTPQPVEASVYFFRHILHDWSDEDCIRIIQSLLPALQDGSRVMLSEGVMPEPPALRSVLFEDKHVR